MRRHTCGTPLVVTHDAIGRPRSRCPRCDRVSVRTARPFDDRDVQSQRHLEVPTPPRSVRSASRDYGSATGTVFLHSDVSGFVEYAPKKPVVIDPSMVFHRPEAKSRAPAWEKGAPKSYRPRVCERPLGCGTPFIPSGSRSKWCPSCEESARTQSKRDSQQRRQAKHDRRRVRAHELATAGRA